jgi:hypothetical protein
VTDLPAPEFWEALFYKDLAEATDVIGIIGIPESIAVQVATASLLGPVHTIPAPVFGGDLPESITVPLLVQAIKSTVRVDVSEANPGSQVGHTMIPQIICQLAPVGIPSYLGHGETHENQA